MTGANSRSVIRTAASQCCICQASSGAPAVAAPAMNHCGQITEHLGTALHEAHRRERHVVGGVLVQVLVVNAHGSGLSARSHGGSLRSVHPHTRLGMPLGSN